MLFLLLIVPGVIHICTCYDYERIQGVTVIKDNFPTKQANVEFGTGYDTLTLQRTYNTAVNVQREGQRKSGYIECTFKIKLCKSRDEFFTAISGGLSASGSYMGVEGSASVKFLTETQITALDTILMVQVDAITDTEIVTNAQYNDASRKLLDNQDFRTFVETYGTHYLRKIILGGKMMLIMKFSSNSREEKNSLDTKLGVSTGTFGAEAEFSAAMKAIRERSSLEISLYASGSNVEPPNPDVESCIKYSIAFAKSVLTYSAVREVEFAAVWTIPGTPDAFKRYLFPLQGETDTIVGLSVDLLNTKSRLQDMIALKKAEMSFISTNAWKEIEHYERTSTNLRDQLQIKYKTSYPENFKAIIGDYTGKAGQINEVIDKLLAKERHYGSDQGMFIKSAGTGLYISTPDGAYPRLDSRSPIPIQMEDISGGTEIKYGGSYYSYITSPTKPGSVLCMGGGNWFVFWVSRRTMNPSDCQWRLAHAINPSKATLQYGDRIIMYNRNWPSYIAGVDSEHKWIGAIDDTEYQDKKHQWFIEKSN